MDIFYHWLPTFLNINIEDGRIKQERAHRSLAPKPGSDQGPRPVIIRFHAFPNKQKVLAAVRCKAAHDDITLEGRKFPSIMTCLLQCFRGERGLMMPKNPSDKSEWNTQCFTLQSYRYCSTVQGKLFSLQLKSCLLCSV